MKIKKKITLNERVEKVYEPEVIPDRTDEFIKKVEDANIRQHDQALAERRHRENLKQKRILASKEDKFIHAINLIIERAEYQKTKRDSFSIDYHDFNFEDTMDESRVLEGLLEKLKKDGAIKGYSRQNYTGGTRFGFSGVNIPKLKQARHKILSSSPSLESESLIEQLILSVKDREIWINNFLIGKPHAVGSNYDFLEQIRSKPPNTKIERKNLDPVLQKDINNIRFFKILNSLGFKGEIKKSFFYKVDGNSLYYRGDKVTKKQLLEAGMNLKLLVKELEVAHAKYNPS